MKNIKSMLIALTILITAPLAGAERPPQPPKLQTFGQMIGEQQEKAESERIQQALEKSSQQALLKARMEAPTSLRGLPEPLQKMVLHFLATPGTYAKIKELANCIIALAETDKAMRAVMNDPKTIFMILNAMPYASNAISLFILLQKKPGSLPVVKSKEMQDWLRTSMLNRANGEELYLQVFRTQREGERTEEERLKTIRDLLSERDLDINFMPNYFGGVAATPLHAAAAWGDKQIVKLLLNVGANPNLADNRGWTPLMYAAKNGNLEMVQNLLAAGADPSYKDSKGNTAFGLAYDKHLDVAAKILEALSKIPKKEMPAKSCTIQ